MSKQFEDLTKNLASGMSRRKAFLRFGVGLGSVFAGLIMRKRAGAAPIHGEECVDFCRCLGLQGEEFGQCVAACQHGIRVNATCRL